MEQNEFLTGLAARARELTKREFKYKNFGDAARRISELENYMRMPAGPVIVNLRTANERCAYLEDLYAQSTAPAPTTAQASAAPASVATKPARSAADLIMERIANTSDPGEKTRLRRENYELLRSTAQTRSTAAADAEWARKYCPEPTAAERATMAKLRATNDPGEKTLIRRQHIANSKK